MIRRQGVFDTDCLTEQSGNKLRLQTTYHGVSVTVTVIVSWYHAPAVSRVCTSKQYTRRFLVFDYEELLLSSGALPNMPTPPVPLHSSISFRTDIIKTS